MANHVNRNNFDENAEDIHNDVSQLADTLEEVLKSWGSDAKEEAEAARVKSSVAAERDPCPPQWSQPGAAGGAGCPSGSL